jgi:hypothetical protein
VSKNRTSDEEAWKFTCDVSIELPHVSPRPSRDYMMWERTWKKYMMVEITWGGGGNWDSVMEGWIVVERVVGLVDASTTVCTLLFFMDGCPKITQRCVDGSVITAKWSVDVWTLHVLLLTCQWVERGLVDLFIVCKLLVVVYWTWLRAWGAISMWLVEKWWGLVDTP